MKTGKGLWIENVEAIGDLWGVWGCGAHGSVQRKEGELGTRLPRSFAADEQRSGAVSRWKEVEKGCVHGRSGEAEAGVTWSPVRACVRDGPRPVGGAGKVGPGWTVWSRNPERTGRWTGVVGTVTAGGALAGRLVVSEEDGPCRAGV